MNTTKKPQGDDMASTKPLRPYPYGRISVSCPPFADGEGEEVIIEAAGRTVSIKLTPGGRKARVEVDGEVIK